MQLVERIWLKPTKELSSLCHKAKNLYNQANYHVRQFYFTLEEYINYYDLQVILKKQECYKVLPAQTSQQILDLVSKNWKSFFQALKEYRINPSKFQGRPKLPKYKEKDGESIVIFTNQNTRIKEQYIHFPKLCNLQPIKTRLTQYQQIRIIPQPYGYMCEIVYNYHETDLHLNPDHVVGIDLGLENLITLVNNIGIAPIIIKGGMLKSVNQFYNKINAQLQSVKDQQGYTFVTKKQRKLLEHRNHKIHDIFHKVSRKVIEYCKENDCGTIVIGYNEGWKQEINIGKRNNQNFVQISYLKLIRMIQYKAKMVGINVIVNEESYTSKCSFLDNETIEKHEIYAGKRIKRGLFRTSSGQVINADVNAGYNIIKKAIPTAYAYGIEDVVLRPISVHFK